MRFTKLSCFLAGMCVPALLMPVQAQTPTQHTVSFIGLFPTPEGKIKYSVWAEIPVYSWHYSLDPKLPVTLQPWDDPPEPEPPILVIENRHTQVDQYDYWYTPHGLFPTRAISQSEAFTKGLKLKQVIAVEASSVQPINRTHYPIKYFESSAALETGGVLGFRSIHTNYLDQGDVVLNVTIPNAPSHSGNRWQLKVTDALGAERYGIYNLAQGPHKITIQDVEAGNVLVSLQAVNNNNVGSTYFQEAYALVRKSSLNLPPATINMEFAGKDSPNRYRIGLFGVGHNSQRYENPLPLQKGREAMVRVMVYDAWGRKDEHDSDINGQEFPVKITWSSPGGSGTQTFDSHISGYHTRSGRVGGSTARMSAIGPLIPPAHVQPGLTVTAQLLQPNTNVVLDTKTISVEVAQPRTITLRGYDVRPPFGSGCTLVRSETQMNNWVLPFTRDVFPYSVINYSYKKKIWMWSYLITWPLGQIFGLFDDSSKEAPYLASIMTKMNVLQGWHDTNLNASSETLYMGMTHKKYGGEDITGMAWYKNRGLAISKTGTDEEIGYSIAHEMGHCFNLYHAKSHNADKGPNRIDSKYPYGGGGLAGGWGYTNIYYNNNNIPAGERLKKHFLAENLHVSNYWHDNNDDAFQIHWDVMSYSNYGTHRTTRFSDYHAEKFKTPVIPAPPAPGDEDSSLFDIYPGTQIWVYGPRGALATEHGLRVLHPHTMSLHGVDSHNNISGGVPLDFEITPAALVADPDGDGTGRPDVIVTRIPRLKSVNIDE